MGETLRAEADAAPSGAMATTPAIMAPVTRKRPRPKRRLCCKREYPAVPHIEPSYLDFLASVKLGYSPFLTVVAR